MRITPDELHICDADFFDEIYAAGSIKRRRDKYQKWAKAGGSMTSTATTVPHELHRSRRAAINPFFSKRSVVTLEPTIQQKVDMLCERFSALAKTDEPVRLEVAYGALTTDVITEYCYGRTDNLLLEPDFKLEWKNAMDTVFSGSAFRRATPWLTVAMQKFPDKYILKMAPALESLLNLQNDIRREAEQALHNYGERKETPQSIFKELLESDIVPPEEKTVEHLVDEGTTIVAAGVETTAKALATASFYLLANPTLLQMLRDELKTVMPKTTSTPTWTQLEQLPFLVCGYYSEANQRKNSDGATDRRHSGKHSALVQCAHSLSSSFGRAAALQ